MRSKPAPSGPSFALACPLAGGRAEAHADARALAGGDLEHVVGGGLGARARGVDRLGGPVDDEVVDRVLRIGRGIGGAEEPLGVRLVLAEQQLGAAVGAQNPVAELGWLRGERADGARRVCRAASVGRATSSPQDQVLRNHSVGRRCRRRRLRPAIVRGHLHQDVVVRRPSRTRRPRRSSDPRRRCRCRAARTPCPACRGRRWLPAGPRRGRRACGYLYWHFM